MSKLMTCTMCGETRRVSEDFIKDSKRKKFSEENAVCDGCREELNK